jgi:hypothetical protein
VKEASHTVSGNRHRIMRFSGLLIWILLGLPALDRSTRGGQEIPRFWAGWIVCFLVFGIAYYLGSSQRGVTRSFRILAIAVRSACIFGPPPTKIRKITEQIIAKSVRASLTMYQNCWALDARRGSNMQ